MKIVLSTPPGKTTELWPPLGLLYIASSCATKRNDEVKVIDAFCENLTQEQLVRRVVAEKPDVFGINCSTHTFVSAMGALSGLNDALPDTKFVLGGFHATFAAERILSKFPFIDFLVKGEGEISFPKLLDSIESGAKPEGLEGIAYSEDGRVVSNAPVLIKDLDSLPFPARELAQEVDYGYFYQNIRLTTGKFTTISSSRGCPFRCAYCSCAAFAEMKWRPRSPEKVVDELEKLYSEGYECCVFVDDNLTNSRRRMERVCELIMARRIKMQFYCEGRVDNASPELMTTMRKAGFTVMYFGVESSQQHVLDYYRKTIRPEQSLQAIKNAKDAGMIVVSSYIFGAPVEAPEDIGKTIEFIRQSRSHAVQVNVLDCLIGTEIWERLEKDGLIGPDDWMRNHRIHEFNRKGLSCEELESLRDKAYDASLDSWKSLEGVIDILGTLRTNKTARTLILKNLFNAEAVKSFIEGRATKGNHPPAPVDSDSKAVST